MAEEITDGWGYRVGTGVKVEAKYEKESGGGSDSTGESSSSENSSSSDSSSSDSSSSDNSSSDSSSSEGDESTPSKGKISLSGSFEVDPLVKGELSTKIRHKILKELKHFVFC